MGTPFSATVPFLLYDPVEGGADPDAPEVEPGDGIAVNHSLVIEAYGS